MTGTRIRSFLLAFGFVIITTTACRAASITDVFVQTSVRQHRITLNVEIQGATGGSATVVARMQNEQGREEKRFDGNLTLDNAPMQVKQISWAWENPRLWDIDQPNLYTLQLEMRGAGVDQAYTQPFGFREIWIEGRRFMLNGSEVHFRPVGIDDRGGNATDIDKRIDELKAQGFNLGEIWPSENDWSKANDLLGERCDRKGFCMTGATPHVSRIQGDWNDPAVKAAYRKELETFIKKARNHPSIILWGSSANAYIDGRDQDPRLIGRSGWIVDLETQMRYQQGLEILREVKDYDPTRLTFTHAGGFVGDVYTLNNYLDFLPLQEREDWLSDWSRNGTMPLFMVEFGTPLFTSYLRGRTDYGSALSTEPMVTEWAAAYFGPSTYAAEKPDYRAAIEARFESGQRYRPWRDGNGHDRSLIQHPGLVATQDLFLRNTWRAWRTWGISGGMVPWEDANYHLDLLKPWNGPSLAWIAGPQNEFTDKAHNFSPGQRVQKSAVLINDYRVPQPYTIRWQVSVSGNKQVTGGAKSGTLKPGERLFVPLQFAAPAVRNGVKADGVITLLAAIGPDRTTDTFPFSVIATPVTQPMSVAVFDPAGETTALLKRLGYAVRPITRATPLSTLRSQLVVVGRRALSDRHALPFDVAALLRDGGRLLVMAQDRLWMRQGLGLRTAEYLARRAYGVNGSEALLAGLSDDNLRDWAGSSHLMPESIPFTGSDPYFTPMYGFHWGNRGAVSSAPVEKPHRTSWRPLLECEFDLAYTPLMEMEYGRGRVTLCTLDLEDHAADDGAARLLAQRVIERAARAPITPKAAKVIYVGSADEAMGEWKTLKVELEVPEDAAFLSVRPSMLSATGIADFDEVTMSPSLSAPSDPDGSFDTLRGWSIEPSGHTKVMSEGGNRFVRITNERADAGYQSEGKFAVDPAWKKVTITCKMRAKHLKLGPADFNDARLAMNFVDASGKMVGNWPAVPWLKSDTSPRNPAGMLSEMGLQFRRVDRLEPGAQVAMIGPDAAVTRAQLKDFTAKGGLALVLRREKSLPGVEVEKTPGFAGSIHAPKWPECAGLSASDLRWKAPYDAWLLKGGAGVQVGADGLLAREKVGRGVILYCQIDPDYLPADEMTYFRTTRWRETRALSQLLANLGASFRQDAREIALLQRPEHPFYLAGEWEVQAIRLVPEKHPRQPNPDTGMSEKAKALAKPDAPGARWEKVYVPAYMESYGPKWKGMDGEAVFRRVLDLPAYFAGKDLVFSCGRVDESETTFFNGVEVGSSNDWLAPRFHVIPGKLVKAGRNVLAVRTYDAMIHGGMCAQPWQLYLWLKSEPTGFYHDDYRDDYAPGDFALGDDPYRYQRW